MKDPPRLLEASASEYERLLLDAGRAEAPPEARRRAMVAATAVLGTTGLAVGAAATGVATKSAAGLSLKWLAVVSLVGVGAVVGASVIETHGQESASRERSEPTILVPSVPPTGAVPRGRGTIGAAPLASATAALSQVAPESSSTPSTEAQTARSTPDIERLPTAVSSVVASPPAPVPSDVRSELHDLEDARAALAAGQPARALSLLDAYAVRHPHATMASEATVIRIEALVRAGDRPSAERLAASFLAAQPQSPYAERVRSLVGASNP